MLPGHPGASLGFSAPFCCPLVSRSPPGGGQQAGAVLAGCPPVHFRCLAVPGTARVPQQSVTALWCCCQVWRSSPCSWPHMMVRLKRATSLLNPALLASEPSAAGRAGAGRPLAPPPNLARVLGGGAAPLAPLCRVPIHL